MNRSELGKRIKEARLAKKMTQSDVAGDFITRNMLSQIESGAANPSLKTLEYLTSVLDIPIQVLLPDSKEAEKEEEENSLYEQLLEMKQLFSEEKYSLTLEAAEKLFDTDLYDEAYALTARSYVNMAQQKERENDLSAAAELADKAYEYADKGLYSSRDVKTAAALLLNKIAEKLEK
ncbi:MAG: helix-turn-helix transcriptional regulator [Ruminococcaceae bacterium]|nr:helix-turn-helix transcriptional regulator [Oscillospiraceae bacterium]